VAFARQAERVADRRLALHDERMVEAGGCVDGRRSDLFARA